MPVKKRREEVNHGINFPGVAEWQNGKTAASLRFVRDANHVLETKQLTDVDRQILAEGIKMIKSGEVSFNTWITPDEWIKQVKDYEFGK